MIVAYQVFLIVAFIIGGPIGRIMTQRTSAFFKHKPRYFDRISSAQNYPYYYMWKNTVLSALKMRQKFLTRYRPSVPTVYLYGKKKPFQFHGPKWVGLFEGEKKR